MPDVPSTQLVTTTSIVEPREQIPDTRSKTAPTSQPELRPTSCVASLLCCLPSSTLKSIAESYSEIRKAPRTAAMDSKAVCHSCIPLSSRTHDADPIRPRTF